MSDDWATPEYIWGKFPDYYDPCKPNGDTLREEDALGTVDAWMNKIEEGEYKGLKLNPPHSDPLPWVERGIKVSKTYPTIMLLRLDSTTQQHKRLIEAGFHPFGAFERIKYGNSDHGGQYANVLWFSP